MKKILVTGGTGFIGRRVIVLLSKKYKKRGVLLLIRNKSNKLERSGRKIIKRLGLKTKLIDLKTGYGLEKVPKNPDAVIHLAANTDTADPDHSLNDLGTKNFINSLGNLNAKTHFIHISTTALMSGRRDCLKAFNERSTPYPTNEYGRTKLNAEKFLIEKCKKDKFRLTILRPPTVYGTEMRKDSFFDFLGKLIKKDSFFSRIDWLGLTSFIHVDDVARSIVYLIKHPPLPGRHQIFILQSESFKLSEIFNMGYVYYKKPYNQIKLPSVFWSLAKYLRVYTYLLESVFPIQYYNFIWRASLIVDNVIYTKSVKIKKLIPSWKPKKLKDNLSLVFPKN